MAEDHYRVLGVERGAFPDEIKRAYRAQVRIHHPDLNPGDVAAENRFKRLSEAYEVLSDPSLRSRYDRGREDDFRIAPVTPQRRRGGFLAFLGSLLSRGAKRGADIQSELRIDFSDSVTGTTTELTVPRRQICRMCQGGGGGCRGCGGSGQEVFEERLRVRLPPGVEDGGMVRIEGRGRPGRPPGDLLVVSRVRPHPQLSRSGRDILLRLPLSAWDAALGANIEVATVNGPVTLRVPEGSQHGQKLRLRGFGVPARNGGDAGDQLVELRIVVPKLDDPRARALLQELKQLGERTESAATEEA